MAPDPTMATAPTDIPNKRQDDFDMGRLQKALKHDQQRSIPSKNKVAKLTPAEIRSLNHSASLSKSGSVRSIDSHSAHRLPSSTPPMTPDIQNYLRRSQSQRRPSAELPTPPLSPDRERRGSASSTRHIHAPRPVSHAQAVHLANSNSISRPSSQASYRGVATYRGNEITRNNSLTMFQHPSQQIVSNPLSQFSRPRQSTMTSTASPPKHSSEHQRGEEVVNSVGTKDFTRSGPAAEHGLTRDHSPVRPSDSPVSMEDGKVPPRHAQKDSEESKAVPVLRLTPKANSAAKQDEETEPLAKQKLGWRRTLTGGSESDPDIAPLRKEFRRRTLLAPRSGYCLHAIHYGDTKAGEPPQLRDSLRDELPSTKTSVFKDDEQKQAALETMYGQHPAVRPLSHDTQRPATDDSDSSPPSSSKKGKEREIDAPGFDSDTSSLSSSVPSYSRCSCCGRVQKPGGFESELSPVMENENLRTNFSFEADRMAANRQRRSSSIRKDGQSKYVPIIPMEVGSVTKQARIEPVRPSSLQTSEPARLSSSHPSEPKSALVGVAINKPGDIIGPGSAPLAIMPRRKIDPRIVRFASLHRTKEDESEDQDQSQTTTSGQDLAPSPTIQRFGSLYGIRNEAQQPQQQQQPAQQQLNSMSAYQTQQLRQQQRTNGSHPLRESHTAHQEVTLPSPTQLAHNHNFPIENGAIEKPLGDSPVLRRNEPAPASPISSFSSDDGEAMVDLSSFDGSFVNDSLSRSATMRHITTPPTTYAQIQSQNQSEIANNRPDGVHPVSLPLSTPTNNTSTESSQRSQQQKQRSSPPPLLNTNLPDPSASPAIYKPLTNTTIVKLVPSVPVSAPSSPSTRGPLKLGDWVLPESPTVKT